MLPNYTVSLAILSLLTQEPGGVVLLTLVGIGVDSCLRFALAG